MNDDLIKMQLKENILQETRSKTEDKIHENFEFLTKKKKEKTKLK